MCVNKNGKCTKRNFKSRRIISAAWVFLWLFTAAGCSGNTEELTLFKRKIGRVDLLHQQVDTYNMNTTISQLITMESRTKTYNFSEGTKIAYETAFITVPATLTYTFGENGGLSSIQYDFEFEEADTEQKVMDVYEECIKFFGYPDEGYTKSIYEYLDQSPSILWVKNNAQIRLDYWMNEDLEPRARLNYRRSEWSGSSVAVFKLPFSPHALGDSITNVVSAETKKNSTTTDSVVRFSYNPSGAELMTVDYVFNGETLQSVRMELKEDHYTRKQMTGLEQQMVTFMKQQFDGAYVDDQTNDRAYDITFYGEAMLIAMHSGKDSGSRNIQIEVELYPYVS